jgi:deoxyuridine 5'-triphosphate nucleotidohydrolase
MSGKIKFLKTREVKSPSRANAYDAGIDFYVPELTDEFIKVLKEKNPQIDPRSFNKEGIFFHGTQRLLIPSGIHCQMSDSHRALIAANKSGIATKYAIIFGAQVVDYEYQGEIHLSLINTGRDAVMITGGMKILQFIETPVFHSEIDVTENKSIEEFYEKETTRGAGGFGSSDYKPGNAIKT